MNGIYFQYFLRLYNGYEPICSEINAGETKKDYQKRINDFVKKDRYNEGEYKVTDKIPILAAVITDNDPVKESKPDKNNLMEGNNPQLFLEVQIANMTDNCRIFKNIKTFEYDLALEKENAIVMINIILDLLTTDGSVKETLTGYLKNYENGSEVKQAEVAYEILKQIDSSYIGKGIFAQLLLEKLEEGTKFVVPSYIRQAVDFVLCIDED